MVTLVCPHCSKSKTVNASLFRGIAGNLNIRCNCGDAFECFIDFRSCYRKQVMLGGVFLNAATQESGEMVVGDISYTGIRFSPVKPHGLSPGDIVNLDFTLDDLKRSRVRRRAVVFRVQGDAVGSAFDAGQSRDSDLNFYLLPCNEKCSLVEKCAEKGKPRKSS
jgi:hypothetical protein